jgi:hypothetical protein
MQPPSSRPSFLLVLFLSLLQLTQCQIISPCVTLCVTTYCPKGIADTGCYCSSHYNDINTCISTSCDVLNNQQQTSLLSQYCSETCVSELICRRDYDDRLEGGDESHCCSEFRYEVNLAETHFRGYEYAS